MAWKARQTTILYHSNFQTKVKHYFQIEFKRCKEISTFLICITIPFNLFLELLIPAKANVYYAINTQHDLNFILKEKENNDKDDFLTNPFASPPGGSLFDRLNDTSSNYGATPKGTRKPARDTSKARRKLLGLTL